MHCAVFNKTGLLQAARRIGMYCRLGLDRLAHEDVSYGDFSVKISVSSSSWEHLGRCLPCILVLSRTEKRVPRSRFCFVS